VLLKTYQPQKIFSVGVVSKFMAPWECARTAECAVALIVGIRTNTGQDWVTSVRNVGEGTSRTLMILWSKIERQLSSSMMRSRMRGTTFGETRNLNIPDQSMRVLRTMQLVVVVVGRPHWLACVQIVGTVVVFNAGPQVKHGWEATNASNAVQDCQGQVEWRSGFPAVIQLGARLLLSRMRVRGLIQEIRSYRKL
jgi:hypothetical protein